MHGPHQVAQKLITCSLSDGFFRIWVSSAFEIFRIPCEKLIDAELKTSRTMIKNAFMLMFFSRQNTCNFYLFRQNPTLNN